MLTAVDFISLAEFETVRPSPDLAVISIGDPDDCAPSALAAHRRALRLHFLDLEAGDEAAVNASGIFTAFEAMEIVDFVKQLHALDTGVRLVVHCLMGASRSAAVALLTEAMTGCDFPRRPDACYANSHVARVGSVVAGCAVAIPGFFDSDPHVYLPPGLQI
ncbi:hypothetical protein G3A43_06545 [Paraburkholderia aspalathi]|nr:hypothetical protein [Paraburkholderia aspalathi]MBK3779908.1 hypothetical protein [Paraburkholderia aspalathi]